MIFVNRLKRELKENKSKIRVKAPLSLISGANWAELNITSLDGNPITLGTPIDDLKFRFQPLLSGAICVPCSYRLDSHSNKPLHQHGFGSESQISFPTLSGALLHVLGSEYEILEK